MPRLILISLAALALNAALLRAAPPNIVMIVSDDHGWSDYGFMGHPRLQTPHLDRLANESVTFRRGYVPSSLCCPSLAAMITGLYPHQNRITCNDPPNPQGLKPAEFQKSPAFAQGREAMNRHLDAVPTLPRMLADQGYWCLQTGKWWQGDFRRGGFTHGMTTGQRHGDAGLDIGRKTLDPIFDFIRSARAAEKPFFVWYAPMMPHQPHNPPARLLEKYRDPAISAHVARYWAMVDWFDETCGQLLDHLTRQGLADNTIVVYLADNGWIQDPARPQPLRSKLTPYDAGLRTPILIRWPGKIEPRKSDELVLSIDLAPTLLAAVGLAPTPAMTGINLLDARARAGRKAVCGECYSHNARDLNEPAKNLLYRWINDGTWKLVLPASDEVKTGPELFEIVADPEEKHNRAAEDPGRVADLTRRLDAWWKPGKP